MLLIAGVVIVLLSVVGGAWAGVSFFSPSARLHRRRRKSHSRIKSKTNRPMIRFSVRPPKK